MENLFKKKKLEDLLEQGKGMEKNKWFRLKTDEQSIFVLNRILFTLSRGSPFHRYLPAA